MHHPTIRLIAALLLGVAGQSGSAQQPLPVIGYIGNNSSNPRSVDGFRKGLAEGGYVEGKNVTIEYRWTEGKPDRVTGYATELVGKRVAVIAAAGGTEASLAAKAATRSIPIVFRVGGDPVAIGLVTSLNRPTGNLTGVTTLGSQLSQKRLELLRELLPAGSSVALVLNPVNPNGEPERVQMQAAAQLLGLKMFVVEAASAAGIEAAFATLIKRGAKGVVTTADPLFFQQRTQFSTLAARHALPTIYSDRIFCDAGGLICYGTDIPDGYRQAGLYVARILSGTKPADLPVQQATKTELVVNLLTAKALGIKIPASILVQATTVIE